MGVEEPGLSLVEANYIAGFGWIQVRVKPKVKRVGT